MEPVRRLRHVTATSQLSLSLHPLLPSSPPMGISSPLPKKLQTCSSPSQSLFAGSASTPAGTGGGPRKQTRGWDFRAGALTGRLAMSTPSLVGVGVGSQQPLACCPAAPGRRSLVANGVGSRDGGHTRGVLFPALENQEENGNSKDRGLGGCHRTPLIGPTEMTGSG